MHDARQNMLCFTSGWTYFGDFLEDPFFLEPHLIPFSSQSRAYSLAIMRLTDEFFTNTSRFLSGFLSSTTLTALDRSCIAGLFLYFSFPWLCFFLLTYLPCLFFVIMDLTIPLVVLSAVPFITWVRDPEGILENESWSLVELKSYGRFSITSTADFFLFEDSGPFSCVCRTSNQNVMTTVDSRWPFLSTGRYVTQKFANACSRF